MWEVKVPPVAPANFDAAVDVATVTPADASAESLAQVQVARDAAKVLAKGVNSGTSLVATLTGNSASDEKTIDDINKGRQPNSLQVSIAASSLTPGELPEGARRPAVLDNQNRPV